MKYKLSNDQMSTSTGSESVILNHKKGSYYSLNEVGSIVWKKLENGPASLDEICTLICNEFEIDADRCQSDIKALLKDLIDEKLVDELS